MVGVRNSPLPCRPEGKLPRRQPQQPVIAPCVALFGCFLLKVEIRRDLREEMFAIDQLATLKAARQRRGAGH